jgi:D-hexose-6-phosphate mutarotase
MKELDVIEQAFSAAKKAESEHIEKHGEDWYCGFAWVVVQPGNSRIARALKEQYGAKKNHSGPGVVVWNPGKSPTQCMNVKEVGASAFAKVLVEAGYDAYASSRPD